MASNQVYMYLYLLPYAFLLQRPKIRITFKRFGMIVPVYLVIGIVNVIVNFGLMSGENVKGTLTTVAHASNIIVIILCVLTLALGFLLMIKTKDKKIAALKTDENAEEDKHFTKGKTAQEKAQQNDDLRNIQNSVDLTAHTLTEPKLIEPTPTIPAKVVPSKPESAKPEVTNIVPAKPEPVKPVPAKPEPVKPEPAKPEPAKKAATNQKEDIAALGPKKGDDGDMY